MTKFINIINALKGGMGSGNFGHSGRPGKIGGSVGGGKGGGGMALAPAGTKPVTRNGQEMQVNKYMYINMHEPGSETEQYVHTGFIDKPGTTRWDKNSTTKGFGVVEYHNTTPESSQLMREHSAFTSGGSVYLSQPLADRLGVSGPEHASILSTPYIRAGSKSLNQAKANVRSEAEANLLDYLSKQ